MGFDATLNTDKGLGQPPKRTRTAQGWRGVRSFRVRCIDPELAWTANGLPQIQDPWSNEHQDLTVVEIDQLPHSGTLIDPQTGGGLTMFEVRYETPGMSGHVPYKPGLKYTEAEPAVTEVTAYKRSSYDPDPDRSIANGRGAQIKIPVLGVSVHVFYDLKWNGLADLLNICGKINKDAVTLPPCLGALTGFAMKPGQLLYLQPEVRQVASLIEVIHRLELARDFKARFANEDSDGNITAPDPADKSERDLVTDPSGNVLMVDVYDRTDMSGLW